MYGHSAPPLRVTCDEPAEHPAPVPRAGVIRCFKGWGAPKRLESAMHADNIASVSSTNSSAPWQYTIEMNFGCSGVTA